jgi:Raf kinase inhibitor-like YbhB/YbcL family protein
MKKSSIVFALLLSAISFTFAQQRTPPMRLTSNAFADGTLIPLKYTQATPSADGPVSPDLSWTNVPPGTQSFVLWMHDVDVSVTKTSEDNLHWLAWNIPGTATSLPEKMPMGALLPDGTCQTSYNGAGYRGPGASAAGPLHHYIFELFALDIKLGDKQGATPIETKTSLFKSMQGHIIGKASWVGLFHRPQ